MALTKCPECGKQVSTNAETCPHCGNPLKEKVEEPSFKPNPKPADTSWVETYKAKRKRNILIVVLMGLAFIGGAVGCFMSLNNISSYDNPGAFYPLLFLGIFFGITGIVLPISAPFTCRVAIREIDGYTVLVYFGAFKNYVLVDNEVKTAGGPFKRSLYVTLANGRQVMVQISAWDGSINISVDR